MLLTVVSVNLSRVLRLSIVNQAYSYSYTAVSAKLNEHEIKRLGEVSEWLKELAWKACIR